MAMSVSSLKSKIKTQIQAQFGTPDDATKLDKFAEAMATAIYDEITQNAVVTSQGSDPPGDGGTVSSTGTIA